MISDTVRTPVLAALRTALRVSEAVAVEIVQVLRNGERLATLEGRDLSSLRIVVRPASEPSPTADLLLDEGAGYEDTGVALSLVYEDIEDWRELPRVEAQAIALEVEAKAGPTLRAKGAEMSAEIADWID
jgi:hypothetical protein